MARKLKRMWSMEHDRELIVLSKTKTFEAIVDHFKRPPAAILMKRGIRAVDQRKEDERPSKYWPPQRYSDDFARTKH